MFRTSLSFLVLLTVCAFANSESPTKSNWASGLDRYIGKFHMINDDNKPTREIESYWVEPNKIFQYSSFSIGDGSNSRGVGFYCFLGQIRSDFFKLQPRQRS